MKENIYNGYTWLEKRKAPKRKELSIDNVKKELLFLNPIFKEMVWGGERLREFDYPLPSEHVGECWGISAHPHGDCTIREGFCEGKRLSEVWREYPMLFGGYESEEYPLLVKIIDAKSDLSIQVHPDDAYARVHESGSLGKTECWYIMDCREDTSLVIGHNARSREEMEEMIDGRRWEEFLREVPVHKGDFIQIDPGTVHTIKGGMVIFETQQSSDITYRLYDYDRRVQGQLRKLHLKQSKDVITVPSRDASKSVRSTLGMSPNRLNEMVSNQYYTVWKLDVEEEFSFEQRYPFMNMSVLEGAGRISGREIRKGDNFIIPAAYGRVELQGRMLLIASIANQAGLKGVYK